jgi:hypothetical protein
MKKSKVAKLFREGTVLNPRHFLGKNNGETEWAVSMLTGPVLDLGFLKHRKRFWLEGDRVVGCNVLREDSCWGYFTVEQGDSLTPTTVAYDDARNGPSRLLVDEVRTTDYAFLVIGKFYVKLLGRKRFVGYFTLRRRGDRPRADLRRAPAPRRQEKTAKVRRREDWK